MRENQAKIVSLVPSWTETLFECGADVIGKSRFCIHPKDKCSSIPSVGGTKLTDASSIIRLKPDFVILDKEENRRELAEELKKAEVEILVSHVSNLVEAADFLQQLSAILRLPRLAELAERYHNLTQNSQRLSRDRFSKILNLPFFTSEQLTSLCYVIWKDPFMIAGEKTFIFSVFQLFGIVLNSPDARAKYPVVDENYLRERFCLFSTEPFPFLKYESDLKTFGNNYRIVDGEKISWFGIRNLLFLEDCLK